ncbi:MAG: hypothetical protein CR962_00920 [Gammaproteobacteria bacterium]|nr:MAG: hypothetical protein CR962_00920 [Gammaproteobacteria bacterium]
MKNKKMLYLAIGGVVLIGIAAEAWHWLNQIPEVRMALVSEKDKPTPVTNDWRLALLECANLKAENGIKASVNSQFERFILNRETGKITPVDNVTARFNWPRDLMKEPADAPSSAKSVHIKRLPVELPFWKVKDSDDVIIPIVAQGKYGLGAGFVAVNLPEKTIANVRFYHSEDSPGLGQEVLRPDFGQRFVNKSLFDASGKFALQIVRPSKTAAANNKPFEVDGITGATMMSDGLEEALSFWTSRAAYGVVFDLSV